jgi:ABC-2 type transport system ATP-binding protein
MIIIDKLVAGYGSKTVLDELSLSLHEGMIHGLVGLNGSGKSTLLKCLCGLIQPISGSIQQNQIPFSRKHISFLETEPYLYHGITGSEYLSLFKSESNNRFNSEEWQNLFNIPLKQLVDSFSTGTKKKLAILGVLKSDKQVMLFDEPFNGLDIESSRILTSILKKLKEQHKTIIVTSHILETLTTMCDQIHYLKNGKIETTFDSKTAGAIDKTIFHELDEEINRRIETLL